MTPAVERMRRWRDRQYAAGFHFVKGVRVSTPRVQPSQRSTFPADEASEEDVPA